MRTNALSALGRMSYGAHLALYPLIFGTGGFAYYTYDQAAKVQQEKDDWENMP